VNGSISKQEAYSIAIFCFVVGVAASIFINISAFVIAFVFGLLAYLYSYKLKDMLLVGNIYIAFSMVIPFIYGSYVVSSKLGIDIMLIGMVIFLAGLAREIHGMVRDFAGDSKARNTKNLVYHIGAARSSQLAFILYVESIIISVYLFFFEVPFAFNLVYIAPIAVCDIILAYIATGYLMHKKDKKFNRFARNASLGAMALALIAFLAAAIIFIHI
jgi:geranylgeranylglycerol-phosphate geranylgeranyltransferase